MKSFQGQSLAIFGRLPQLSLAELQALYSVEHLRPLDGGALLDIAVDQIDFRRLGGTVKLAKVLSVLDTTDWPKLQKFLETNIPPHLAHLPDGAFTLGLSLYGYDVPLDQVHRGLMSIKKIIKKTGRPVRIVPNKNHQLNSAQVLHNKLTTKGAWELILFRDGGRSLLAQTIFVQDIDAYAARDQARPKRDARVGMLPPKLAQTMINLINPEPGATILDPFCGTGVILQEASLMDYKVIGSDKEPRLVDFASQNLGWLKQKYPRLADPVDIFQADATDHRWPKFDHVVSELYLGRPFGHFPPESELAQVKSDVNTIAKKFLGNLAPQLSSGSRLCLALPAWQKPSGGYIFLPLIDHLTDMGYNYLDLAPASGLIYSRPDQVVARQLLTLTKA